MTRQTPTLETLHPTSDRAPSPILRVRLLRAAGWGTLMLLFFGACNTNNLAGPPDPGGVEGRVTLDGAGLDGIGVVARPVDVDGVDNNVVTTTAADGSFRLELEDGQWAIEIANLEDLEPTLGVTFENPSQSVTITNGQTVTVNFQASWDAGSASFRACGDPLGDAAAVLFATADDRWRYEEDLAGAAGRHSLPAGADQGGAVAILTTLDDEVQGDVALTRIVAFGPGEASRIEDFTCPLGPGSKTVLSRVAGVSAGETAQVHIAPAFGFHIGGQGDVASILRGIPDGPRTLIGIRYRVDAASGRVVVIDAARRDDVDPNDGAILDHVDFGQEGFGLDVFTYTVDNLGSDFVDFVPRLWLHDGSLIRYTPDDGGTATQGEYLAFPSDFTQPGDLLVLEVGGQNGVVNATREHRLVTSTPGNLAFVLGPQLDPIVVDDDPVAGLSVALPVQDDYDRRLTVTLDQPTTNRRVVIDVTEGARGETDWLVEGLDFSALGDTGTPFQLDPDEDIEWTVRAFGWAAGGTAAGPPRMDGVEQRSASRSGTVVR